jgi:hypothetical protein
MRTSKGTLTVNIKNSTAGKTVYYRINKQSWQLSNVFNNLTDGLYKVEIKEESASLDYNNGSACFGISGSLDLDVSCTSIKPSSTFSCGGFILNNDKSILN